MLIFKVAKKSHSNEYAEALLDSAGIITCNIDASSFSFLTSMRIATEYKKHNPDAVIVYRIKDAVGAISARDIVRTDTQQHPYPVIFNATEKTKVPVSLTSTIQTGVDVWIFDCVQTHKKWQNLVGSLNKRVEIIPQPGENTPIALKEKTDCNPTLLYPGEIGQAANLAGVINAIIRNNLTSKLSLRVLGTGNARYVMPLVKKARANNVDIVWTGDEYDLEKELSGADGFICSSNVPTGAELRLLANGIPAVNAETLENWVNNDERAEMKNKAKLSFQSHYTPTVFIEKVKTLLSDLRQ